MCIITVKLPNLKVLIKNLKHSDVFAFFLVLVLVCVRVYIHTQTLFVDESSQHFTSKYLDMILYTIIISNTFNNDTILPYSPFLNFPNCPNNVLYSCSPPPHPSPTQGHTPNILFLHLQLFPVLLPLSLTMTSLKNPVQMFCRLSHHLDLCDHFLIRFRLNNFGKSTT